MNCEGIRKFLDAYMDGELEAPFMLEVEHHIDSCSNCSSLLHLKQDIKKQFSSMGSVKAPARLVEAIELQSSKRYNFLKKSSILLHMAAAAALFLFFVNTSKSPPVSNEPAIMNQVVDDVVDRHVRSLPMEVSNTTGIQAANWFQGKIDFPVKPISTRVNNAHFEGARVSNIREHQAAHMVYNIEGHRVTLMIFPAGQLKVLAPDAPTLSGKQVLTGRRNGYNVAMIKDNDMIYALSSHLPAKKLVSLLHASELIKK
jgi:anti-sigma factor RsiW